jgi:hypothetical protein
MAGSIYGAIVVALRRKRNMRAISSGSDVTCAPENFMSRRLRKRKYLAINFKRG